MKKKFYKVIMLAMLYALLATACNSPYDKITENDDNIIICMVEYYTFEGKQYIQALDNKGNVYEVANINVSSQEYIDSGEIFNCEISQQLGLNDVEAYYELLCNVNDKKEMERVSEGGHDEEPYVAYYGIRYKEGNVEKILLWQGGVDEHILQDQYAKEIVEWMKSWAWKTNTEL